MNSLLAMQMVGTLGITKHKLEPLNKSEKFVPTYQQTQGTVEKHIHTKIGLHYS